MSSILTSYQVKSAQVRFHCSLSITKIDKRILEKNLHKLKENNSWHFQDGQLLAPENLKLKKKIMKSFTIIKDKLATVVNWHFSVIVKNVMQLLSHEDF